MKIEQTIRKNHDAYRQLYEEFSLQVKELLQNACESRKWYFTDRLKSVESYALKILTGRYDRYEIDDFYACTIVVPNLTLIKDAQSLVEDIFKIIEKKPGDTIYYRPTEFNFDGIRYYCSLKESVVQKSDNGLKFEVQIKTFLEHAWSVATHDFSYKGKELSWSKERLSAQIKAILDNADMTILEMDNVSKSQPLNKRNPKYDIIVKTIEFVESKFGKQHNIALPEDMKRLAREIDRVLKTSKVKLCELEILLDEETKLERGYKTTNLSIYSIVLVALFNQATAKFVAGLTPKPKRNFPSIIIPEETRLYDELKDENLEGVTFLEHIS
ncbi:RelA/SpoT domain-containing protein [uncultured Sneathiella sp.]|uniref:RelA/SpoT domain-containing protein n=1 Tax=uncultured Sneathiella sp. TaxID=879315 RepID=UPI0030EB92A2|tara:strand:- start:9646 stop:10629 length:984 start_codon:yes stop_codon:yes gene_type:complete